MTAGDGLGIFLLVVLVGFIFAFIYMVWLQRRAVATQTKAATHVTTMTSQQETSLANTQRMLELQEQSAQGHLLALQIAKQQLVLQQEHNTLLRELLTRLVEHTLAESTKPEETTVQ
jgi:predicted negative regulator of RcsB-dependent stress response